MEKDKGRGGDVGTEIAPGRDRERSNVPARGKPGSISLNLIALAKSTVCTHPPPDQQAVFFGYLLSARSFEEVAKVATLSR